MTLMRPAIPGVALLFGIVLMGACSGSDDDVGAEAADPTEAAVLGGSPAANDPLLGPVLPDLPGAEARPEAGDDPEIDRLAQQCQLGVVIACDMLAAVSPPDSVFLDYAQTCGGRSPAVFSCAVEFSDLTVSIEAFDGEVLPEPGPAPSGSEGELDRLARECRDTDLLACDVLQFRTEAGSLHHAYASTCGGRAEHPVVCTVWFRLLDPAVVVATTTTEPSS
ncbi:MAG: hypothetical protein GY745_21775 [Actinomycetia bacterium]|nr:hypothetical protein [Actinomycetes bacterium]